MLFSVYSVTFVSVKKVISIVLLLVLFVSNTEFHQLMKVPVLISHYLEHRQNDRSLTFTDFVLAHYMDGHSHDQEHRHLPFKSHECQHMLLLAFPEANAVQQIALQDPVNEVPVYNEGIYSSAALNAIWQPPQFV